MHNVSVGDLFVGGDEIYRVVKIFPSFEYPNDPYLQVEHLVAGDGFVQEHFSNKEAFGFSVEQASDYKLQHYKAVQ